MAPQTQRAMPARMRAGPDRLREILDNLLSNVLRPTPAGGAVTVATARQADLVAATVTDTGDGIAAEHPPHLFDRFYRADPARRRATGGSGIGLTIARAHGGDLRADSDGLGHGLGHGHGHGHGATFLPPDRPPRTGRWSSPNRPDYPTAVGGFRNGTFGPLR